nr:cyclic pyranopterin monophosphate synthase MoaC [Candidatus Njordarchaeum guaymaensis]
MSPVHMVDVGQKDDLVRVARATGRITLKPETIQRMRNNSIEKGDVISCAQIAGILSAKKTHEIIPLCHPIPITNAVVDVEIEGNDVVVVSEVSALAKTGVEMEALSATAAALLTIWDMTKKYEKDERGQYPSTKIKEIHVLSKTKGAREKNELP